MALGGGIWTSQDKVLPGSYINFVSASRADASLSDRGIAAMPLELDWGPEGEVFSVTSDDFRRKTRTIFGYTYADEKMKGLRDLFRNIRTGLFYRLGNGTAASNTYATAKYAGTRGNVITIVITKNADDEQKFDVSTMFDTELVDKQTVSAAAGLKPNDYVTWKSAQLAVTAGLPLTGGANATSVSGAAYQSFLDAIESHSFHALGCLTTDTSAKAVIVAWTKRMRDEVGMKFQTVLYQPENADYEGVIAVKNKTTDADWPESSAVYWLTGAQAGCAVNKSCTNKLYDGEFSIETPYTQAQLAQNIIDGMLMFHRVGDSVRVLRDVNSLVTLSETKGEDFRSNQTMRVLDQIANDTAALFNTKYLGSFPNDNAGRVSLWSDIVSLHQKLQTLHAIEGFESDHITVAQGDTKRAVVVNGVVTPVNAMEQLYMSVTVS